MMSEAQDKGQYGANPVMMWLRQCTPAVLVLSFLAADAFVEQLPSIWSMMSVKTPCARVELVNMSARIFPWQCRLEGDVVSDENDLETRSALLWRQLDVLSSRGQSLPAIFLSAIKPLEDPPNPAGRRIWNGSARYTWGQSLWIWPRSPSPVQMQVYSSEGMFILRRHHSGHRSVATPTNEEGEAYSRSLVYMPRDAHHVHEGREEGLRARWTRIPLPACGASVERTYLNLLPPRYACMGKFPAMEWAAPQTRGNRGYVGVFESLAGLAMGLGYCMSAPGSRGSSSASSSAGVGWPEVVANF